MSEGSIPPFGIFRSKKSPLFLAKRVAGHFKRRFRRSRSEKEPGPDNLDPALRSRAAEAIRGYSDAHATLFERAERLRERAERLESQGTPSDSAGNRAERAEDEIVAGLIGLRDSFRAATGEKGGIAFDEEAEALFPSLKLSSFSQLRSI